MQPPDTGRGQRHGRGRACTADADQDHPGTAQHALDVPWAAARPQVDPAVELHAAAVATLLPEAEVSGFRSRRVLHVPGTDQALQGVVHVGLGGIRVRAANPADDLRRPGRAIDCSDEAPQPPARIGDLRRDPVDAATDPDLAPGGAVRRVLRLNSWPAHGWISLNQAAVLRAGWGAATEGSRPGQPRERGQASV
jgi:hypothetical protein